MTRFSRQQSYVSLTALEMILLTGVLSFLDSAQGKSYEFYMKLFKRLPFFKLACNLRVFQ